MREIKFRAKDEKTGMEYIVYTQDAPRDNRGAHNFKGYEISGGYVLRKVNNHPYANSRGYYLEHRLIMELHLGRFLRDDEVVHHKDGDRKNNKLENLELVVNQSKHATIEDRGKRNPNGTIVASEPIFEDIKFRLYDKDRVITKIYTLSKLVNTTFRRGCFSFRGRFTGLHDKNGVEIYEGDIVAFPDTESEYVDVEVGSLKVAESQVNSWGEVVFKDGSFGLDIKAKTEAFGSKRFYTWAEVIDYCSENELEIIGNKFENPELIQEKGKR